MRLFVFSLLIAVAGGQSVNPTLNPVQPSNKVRLEGSVVGFTGEAIPRATVRLTGGTAATATADDAGKFVFEGVTPGSDYRLMAQRPGYINGQFGARSANRPGTPLTLSEGQVLKGLTITMTPQGVLSGKVSDRDNDPIQKATVYAFRIVYQRGVRSLGFSGNASTNDKGEYRIANLPPGRYYVGTLDQPRQQSVESLITGVADRTSATEVNVGTYYPSAADLQSATPVEITPGADLRDVDIRMLSSRTFTVRGKVVTSATGGPTGVLLLRALPKLNATPPVDILRALAPITTQNAQDGTFELRNMPSGEWTITGIGSIPVNGGAATNLSGSVTVPINDQDVAGVVLPLDGGVTISGNLRLGGGDIKTVFAAGAQSALVLDLPAIRPIVTLTAVVGAAQQSIQTNQDGTFKAALSVALGKFRVSLVRVPEQYYAKSVLLGRNDVTHGVLDSASESGPIDIVLSDKPAELSGKVASEKDGSTAGVTMAAWTKEPALASSTNGVWTTYADQNGRFQFKGLPPGEYYVAAWEDADPEQLQNRDLLAMFSDDAAKIKLAEGVKQSVEAKLITSEKLAVAMAKLP